MTLPRQKDVEIPLLEEIENAGGKAEPQQVYPRVAGHFPQITDTDLKERLESGHNTWTNRVQWVRQLLVNKGQLDGSVRGVWSITELGRGRLEAHRKGLPFVESGGKQERTAAQAAGVDATRTKSVLNAVFEVLTAAGRPLHYGKIADRAIKDGLWQTSGKTPWATFNGRLSTDINTLGPRSRFRRVGRGTYALNQAKPQESARDRKERLGPTGSPRFDHDDIARALEKLGKAFGFDTIWKPKVNDLRPDRRAFKSKRKTLDVAWQVGNVTWVPIEVQVAGSVPDLMYRFQQVHQWSVRLIVVAVPAFQDEIEEVVGEYPFRDKLILLDPKEVLAATRNLDKLLALRAKIFEQ